MRYLHSEELEVAKLLYDHAIEQAKMATCAKSQRGVIFTENDVIVGKGYNGPPEGYLCSPEHCGAVCGRYAVHAEKRALFEALKFGKPDRGYHVKLQHGIPACSSGPSCEQCSKDMLVAGVNEFVLQLKDGFALYSINEFHDLTLAAVFGEEFPLVMKK